MKKSKDITKYNIHWQVVRVQLKKEKEIENKLAMAYSFFMKHKTKDNQERVMNWLEGLALGYKATKQFDVIQRIKEEEIRYEINDELPKEENRISSVKEISNYSFDDCLDLYEDLQARNKQWLKKGYIQKEINEFIDNLVETFDHYPSFKAAVKKMLIDLRAEAATKKNTHKFFF